MIAFLEIALRLQNAHILPLDLWKDVPAPGSPGTATRGDYSSATFSMVALDASQLVLRVFKDECID